MPRESLNIEPILPGMNSKFDVGDGPPALASYAVNCDFDTEPGAVVGRYTDAAITTETGIKSPAASAWIEQSDGKRDLLYYNSNDGTVRARIDFHGTVADPAALGTPGTGKTVSMQVQNQHAHVGLGNASTSKWVGRIATGQFSGAAPSGYQYLDSELRPLINLPLIHKAIYKSISGTDYIFGIEWDGRRVFKINLSTNTYTYSPVEFEELHSICEFDGTYFLILDANDAISTKGVVYKLRLSDMGIEEQYIIDTPDPALSGIFSDIEVTDTYLWLAQYEYSGTEATPSMYVQGYQTAEPPSRRFLYAVARADLTGGALINPIGLNIGYQTNSVAINGVWYDVGTSAASLWTYKKRPLVKSVQNSDEIIYLVDFEDGNFAYLYTLAAGAATPAVLGDCAMVIHEDIVTANSGLFTYQGSGIANHFCLMGNQTAALTDPAYPNDRGDALDADGEVVTADAGYVKLVQLASDTYDFEAVVSASAQPSGTEYNLLGLSGNGKTVYMGNDTLAFTSLDNYVATVPNWAEIANESTLGGITSGGTPVYLGHVAEFISFGVMATTQSATAFGGRLYSRTLDVTGPTFGSASYRIVSEFFMDVAEVSTPVGAFSTTKGYFFKASLIYDGVQESPLNPVFGYETAETVASATKSFRIKMWIINPTGRLSKRVTHVNIYRAEASSTTANKPTTSYRLVATLPLEDLWSKDPTYSASWGDAYYAIIYDQGSYGVAYQESAGTSEVLDVTTLNWKLSCQFNSYHFIADVANTYITDGSHLLVRSKPFCFDQFDWTNDYLYLPFIPKAMAAHGGRLYIFNEDRFIIVNPELLVIEHTFHGRGAVNEKAVLSTPRGLYFANNNGVYLVNGTEVIDVSDPINESTELSGLVGYREDINTTGLSPILVSMSRWSSVAVVMQKNGASPVIWLFNDSNYWHRWTIPTTVTLTTSGNNHGAFSDKDGYLYIGCSNGTYKVASNSSRHTSWVWYSRVFSMGDPEQNKRWYALQSVTSGSIGLQVDYERAGTFATLTAKVLKKTAMVRALATDASAKLNSFRLVFRQLIGKR